MLLEDIKTESYRESLNSFLCFLQNDKFYSDGAVKNYRRTLANIDTYLVSNGIESYSPAIGEDYYQEYLIGKRPDSSRSKSVRTMIRRLNAFVSGNPYVIQLNYKTEICLPVDFTESVQSYLDACAENGNKKSTIKDKKSCLYRFLDRCRFLDCEHIKDLTSEIILKACLSVNDKDDWNIIRAFFVHLCQNGYLDIDYSTLVPHYTKQHPVPTVYSNEEIRRIENAPDRETPIGKRDYAIILLATRLGMRSGDIVGLRFEDINKSDGYIHFIQEKTGKPLTLPLLDAVSSALEDYILHSRPASAEDKIFLRHNAPHVPITTSVLRFNITKYFQKAGIDYAGKKHGPHAFRSSLASSMVNDGYPYESIRSILGHSDPDAIKHYAKLDTNRLRVCALPVPPPTGSFKSFLKGGF